MKIYLIYLVNEKKNFIKVTWILLKWSWIVVGNLDYYIIYMDAHVMKVKKRWTTIFYSYPKRRLSWLIQKCKNFQSFNPRAHTRGCHWGWLKKIMKHNDGLLMIALAQKHCVSREKLKYINKRIHLHTHYKYYLMKRNTDEKKIKWKRKRKKR